MVERDSEWRRVRVWFGEFAIADSVCVTEMADRVESAHRKRFVNLARIRITNEPASPPD